MINKLLVSLIIVFIITVVTGIIVAILGKPYNTLLFTIHKLIALGSVIISVILVKNIINNTNNINGTTLIFIIISGILIITLFATGAIMSISERKILLVYIHSITPILLLISSTISIYLLLKL